MLYIDALIILLEYVLYSVFFYVYYSKPVTYTNFPKQELTPGVPVPTPDLSLNNFFFEVRSASVCDGKACWTHHILHTPL